jgi:hypothetical protein
MQGLFDVVDIDNKHIEEVRRLTDSTWNKISLIRVRLVAAVIVKHANYSYLSLLLLLLLLLLLF